MMYQNQLKTISIQNKYLKWYLSIVTKAQFRAKTRKEAKAQIGYCELHHILPRKFKMGGDYDPLNYAFLTAREHYICHLLLVRFSVGLNKHKMVYAANLNAHSAEKNGVKINSRLYDQIKRNISEQRKGKARPPHVGAMSSAKQKGKRTGPENHFYGQTHTPEAIEKIKAANIGRKHSEETREKIRNGNKGKVISPETRKKMSELRKGTSSPLIGTERSAEFKAKVSAGLKGKPSKLKGRVLSEETKQKLSTAKKGKVFTEEHKQKLRDAAKTRKKTPRTKPSPLKGKSRPDSVKEKISQTVTQRHIEKGHLIGRRPNSH